MSNLSNFTNEQLALQCDTFLPDKAKEIENIILTEEDVDTQIVRLKALLAETATQAVRAGVL